MNKYVVGIMLAVPFGLACGPVPPPNGGTAGTGGNPSNPFCAVERVLQSKCQSCHAATPTGGAPFPLMSYADTQKTHNGTPIWQRIKERVRTDSMPPTGWTPRPDAAEKAVIAAWNGTGSECSVDPNATTCPQNPSRCVGEEHLPCQVTHRFLAHAPGNKAAKFTVAAGAADEYWCFDFVNPFFGTQQVARAEAPVVDNDAVIHHWLLFGTNEGRADGGIRGGCVQPEIGNSKLLSGWAPGGTNTVMPDDVRMEMGKYRYLELQVHYNNPVPIAGPDASGVAYCIEPNPGGRALAGITTLGTDNLLIPVGAKDVVGGTGTCNNLPTTLNPVFILGSSPHMHKLGSGFKTEQIRGGQVIDHISNIPIGGWSFDKQIHYMYTKPKEVRPGDTLRTTCYYSNPSQFPFVGFGTRTIDEMCYDFAMVYPINQARGECGQGITFGL